MSKTKTLWCALMPLAVLGNGTLVATTLQQDTLAAQVEQLLESGVDPNAEIRSGTTLLMWAAWSGHLEVVGLLLARGADPNAKDPTSLTVLMGAAGQGHAEVVRMLLDHGADVHATGQGGMTAVRLAAANGRSDAIDVLVGYGAATTEAEVYRDVMGHQFVLPHARNVDARPNEDGDVVLGIDRDGGLFLDSGDGEMRRIPKDSLDGVLSPVYGEPGRDRILYFVTDSTVEYEVIWEVVEIAGKAGVMVLSAVAEQESEPIALNRAAMDVQIPGEGNGRLLAPQGVSSNQIVLQLLEDGLYALNSEPVLLSQLDGHIRAIFDARPAKLMFVQVAGNRGYQDVITAMDIARGAGVQVIGIAPPGEVPQAIPPVDLGERFDPRDYTGVGVESGVIGDSSRVFKDAVVDVLPELVSCPPVEYPAEMRQAAVEGVVVLQFVVEIDGHVELGMIQVVRSTQEAFEAPAKKMLAGCTFRPGMVRQTAVRVLVEMPLTFTLQ
jgi:TonB family protein